MIAAFRGSEKGFDAAAVADQHTEVWLKSSFRQQQIGLIKRLRHFPLIPGLILPCRLNLPNSDSLETKMGRHGFHVQNNGLPMIPP
jgi:hypothetical protein